MASLCVLLGFANALDRDLDETAEQVLAGLCSNSTFPTPPVTAAKPQAALTAFTDINGVQAQGSTAATAVKDQMGQTLIGLRRQLALYAQTTVQNNCAYGLAELPSSGFDAASTSRARMPLDTPPIKRINSTGIGQLAQRMMPESNARLCEAQSHTATGVGEWTNTRMYQSSRGMLVTGLVPGQTYTLRMRAVGGRE